MLGRHRFPLQSLQFQIEPLLLSRGLTHDLFINILDEANQVSAGDAQSQQVVKVLWLERPIENVTIQLVTLDLLWYMRLMCI
jgi:hypothetical protein